MKAVRKERLSVDVTPAYLHFCGDFRKCGIRIAASNSVHYRNQDTKVSHIGMSDIRARDFKM